MPLNLNNTVIAARSDVGKLFQETITRSKSASGDASGRLAKPPSCSALFFAKIATAIDAAASINGKRGFDYRVLIQVVESLRSNRNMLLASATN
jgi:hypothetical protein